MADGYTTRGGIQPGYTTAAARIAEYISQEGLRPGDRLPTERAFGELLGVSRTVVREAVKVLAATGMVRARQGSGLFVAEWTRPFATAAIDLSMPVDPEHMVSLFEFRSTLEPTTARLAAERIAPREVQALHEAVRRNRLGADAANAIAFHDSDTALHTTIAAASRNPFLASAVTSVVQLQHWAVELIVGTPGSMLLAADQHAAIVDAISRGEASAAAEAMEAHIQTVLTAFQAEVRRRLVGNHIETAGRVSSHHVIGSMKE